MRVKVTMAGTERTYTLEVSEADYEQAILEFRGGLEGTEEHTASPVVLNLAHVARLERAAS